MTDNTLFSLEWWTAVLVHLKQLDPHYYYYESLEVKSTRQDKVAGGYYLECPRGGKSSAAQLQVYASIAFDGEQPTLFLWHYNMWQSGPVACSFVSPAEVANSLYIYRLRKEAERG